MEKPFIAIVLAADRNQDDPVASAAKVSCKALTPIAGRPMVLRVLDALNSSRLIGKTLLSGPPRSIVEEHEILNRYVSNSHIRWLENESSPSASAYSALKSLSDSTPTLLTTADHALLNDEILDYFCDQARSSGYDLVVGLTYYETLRTTYPEVKRTTLKFRDNNYCSCNLFAFLTKQSREAANFWRQIENQRKKPWQIMRALGWFSVLRYLLGKMTLDEGLERLSKILGIKIGAIILPFPEAAIDVDNPADWMLVQKIYLSRLRMHRLECVDFRQGLGVKSQE